MPPVSQARNAAPLHRSSASANTICVFVEHDLLAVQIFEGDEIVDQFGRDLIDDSSVTAIERKIVGQLYRARAAEANSAPGRKLDVRDAR